VKGELDISRPYPDGGSPESYDDPNGARTPTGNDPQRQIVVAVGGELAPLALWAEDVTKLDLTTGMSVSWIWTDNRGAEPSAADSDFEIVAYVSVGY
jgi:hypothetical protein